MKKMRSQFDLNMDMGLKPPDGVVYDKNDYVYVCIELVSASPFTYKEHNDLIVLLNA